jgi:hypothetical protein
MTFWNRARCSGHFTGSETHSDFFRSISSDAVVGSAEPAEQ